MSPVAYLGALFNIAVLMHPLALMRLARTELALTDKRILGVTGIGKRTIVSLPFGEVESVVVRRGVLGWVFDYGSVVVTDKEGKRTQFRGVRWPLVFQQEANEAVEIAVLGHKLSDYVPNS